MSALYARIRASRSRRRSSIADGEMRKRTTRKAKNARAATALEEIPNIGASIAGDLRSIGIRRPQDLIGRAPHALYLALCERTRARQDPCVLDTFISVVRFMEGAPARPWWHYTAERKKQFSDVSVIRRARRS